MYKTLDTQENKALSERAREMISRSKRQIASTREAINKSRETIKLMQENNLRQNGSNPHQDE